MSQIGYAVVVLNLAHEVYDYRLPAQTTTDPKAIHCYNYQFQQVDERWQIQNEDTSETAEVYGQCLSKNGLPTIGTEADLKRELNSAGLDAMAC